MPGLFPDNKRASAFRQHLEKKVDQWRAGKQTVGIDTSIYSRYTGIYRTFIQGVPWNISITSNGGKLWYSTSESGRAELSPTSGTTFFMVDYNGIYDVEFTPGEVITRFGNFRLKATRQTGQPVKW
jgi:hypothetical protein